MKKIISILMCLALLFSLIPAGMISASAEVVTVRFNFQCTIDGIPDYTIVLRTDADGYVPIPEEYEREYNDEGLVFYGWYKSANCYAFESFDFEKPISEATTLYALYVDENDICPVTGYRWSDGGWTECYYDDFCLTQYGYMPYKEFSMEDGQVFYDWYTSPDLAPEHRFTSLSDFSDTYTTDDDWREGISLYARYVDPDDVITIYYVSKDMTNPNNPGYSEKIIKGDCYKPLTMTDEEEPDKIFVGYYTDPHFYNKFDENQPVTEDTWLYPRFVDDDDEIAVVRWFLDPEDEYPAAGVELIIGDYFTPPDPGRENQVFLGWYTDKSFKHIYNGVVEGDTDLYARFVDEEDIAVVRWFLNPDDEYPVAGVEQIIGDYFTPPDPGRENQVFLGWYTDKSFKHIYNGFVEGDTDLYARFVDEEDIAVVRWFLTADADEPVAGVAVEKGDVFGDPPAPGREGEVFLGWYTDRALTKRYDPTAPIMADTELFPKFLPEDEVEYISIRIYFDPGAPDEENLIGFDWPKELPVGSPAEPGKEGASFDGWFLDRKLTVPFVAGIAYDHDIQLFPKFTWPNPTITAFSNTQGGLKVTWTDVGEYAFYTLFRKGPNDKNWVKIAVAINDNYYIDNTAVSGTTYTYTVRCVNYNNTIYQSGYNAAGWRYTYYTMPKINQISVGTTGLNLTWNKSNGAYGYKVFRKVNGSWKTIAVTTATNYTDKNVVSGNSYTYTVRAVNKSGSFITSYDPNGMTASYVAAPKVSKIENTTTGATLTWAKCTGAKKYRVFIKSGTSWKKLADTASLTYTHTAAVSGKSYTYTVRALDSKGAFCSAFYSAGWTNKFIATPAAPTLKNTKNGVQITSTLPAGCVKYCVFRKDYGSTKWTRIQTNINASKKLVIDATAKNGKKYTYTIRCLSSDGKSYVSGYNATGRTITCKR